ncbi:leucine-rich repeat flightless-interacting protein 2 isoform X2 [Plodia interpunctella]|uniref:leucine-rich repeat flightless-interacting protein 2 isoform X2 n=1 Tax=Plodia interpunctella TaxID=58824 RepID=UPI0023682B22|nr:leucine-rich repeat flightless-interacting protein 2 isoform X2 [Plodia interpunctella]
MGETSKLETPGNSDEESGDAFTDGDFEDSEDETVVERNGSVETSNIPVNEAVNGEAKTNGCESIADVYDSQAKMNGVKNYNNGHNSEVDNANFDNGLLDVRRDSLVEQNPSIVGILGDQQNHAEQRLAARRAARAEAREIRMRELQKQQQEQENHADKAYDMYAESVGRRAGSRLAALSPAVHSPRRSSEDSVDDTFTLKELRHELKEVEEKFRKAMILNAQLDNDKAALGYQLELLKDRIEELHEEYAQLQREHKEKCSAHERLKRSHASLERELASARDAVRARDGAALAAGFAFVDAASAPEGGGAGPALALVSQQSEQLLTDAGEGTLDVRLQKLLASKQSLESEVRKLKLQLNEERAARQNGVANHHDAEYESELETLRRSVSESKARAARAEAEAALQAAAAVRREAQLARLRARQERQDGLEELLKQERRKLQREEVVDFWAEINNGNS